METPGQPTQTKITVLLTEVDVTALDEARGYVPRSKWIRDQIRKMLTQDMEPCDEFGSHPRGGHEDMVTATATPATGATPDPVVAQIMERVIADAGGTIDKSHRHKGKVIETKSIKGRRVQIVECTECKERWER